MVARTQIAPGKDDLEGLTVPELVFSLKSAFQNSYFTRVEEILVSREEKLKKQIEGKNRENQSLLEKLLRFQKECAELREERDELLKRVNDNAAKTELDFCKKRLKELKETEGTRKFDSGENSSQKKSTDNRRLLSENIVEIADSDDESHSPECARGIVTEGHLHKADSAQNVAENEPAVHKRKLASSVDLDDSCPTERDKQVKLEDPAPLASPIEHISPAVPNLETRYIGKGDLSSNLSKLLSELGDDSSSSSSSDDEVDLSLDYSSIFKTFD